MTAARTAGAAAVCKERDAPSMHPRFVESHDVAHLCFGQQTPVKTTYPLTGIMWPYRGLEIGAHRGLVFENDR